MGVRAIDVSVWQGVIDWNAVKADGVMAAWIKVSGADGRDGDGRYRDHYAQANLDGAQAAGVEHGTYHFCVPDHDPEGQAAHAVNCGHGTGALPPAADLEVNPHGLSQLEVDQWCVAFCAEVMHLSGRESIVYTYSSAGLVGYTPAAPSHCRLWVANYGSNSPGSAPPLFNPAIPPAWGGWDVWQFNSVTEVRGIEGHVDQNVIADEMWADLTGSHHSPATSSEDHMDTLIVDGRPGSLSAWLLSGRWKTWIPTSEYATFLEGAAKNGDADLKTPPNGVLQGGGSPWIARLDLAAITNPGRTPQHLGGSAAVSVADHEQEVRAHLEQSGIAPPPPS